jgi:integrase
MSGAARRGRPLTAAFVNTVKDPGKYHDGQGTGLFLLVRPNGSRFWIQRIVVRGKRRELGLGSPPVVSLAEAREQAIENKRIVRRGNDPVAARQKAREALTFEEAAREAHKELAPTWKNPKDRKAFLTSLERHVFPRFGDMALSDVTSADIRQAILAARENAPAVARKLVFRISAVFKWSIAEGHCTGNPATTQALALPRETRQAQHFKSLPYHDTAQCIATIQQSKAWPATKLALEFVILTATRSAETRKARWDQIDLHGASSLATANQVTWTLDTADKKEKRAFQIPLSTRAIEILREAETLRDRSGLIFPSMRGKPLSDMTLSKLVKELGFDADVHGFRATFRTWAQEQTDTPWEVAEAALAHKLGNAVEQAYARSDLFEKRKQLMADWASYLAVN